MEKCFNISELNLRFISFGNIKDPKFVFADSKGDLHQVLMSTEFVTPGQALFASLLAIEKYLAKE